MKPLKAYYNRKNLAWCAFVAAWMAVLGAIATQQVTFVHLFGFVFLTLVIPVLQYREAMISAEQEADADR